MTITLRKLEVTDPGLLEKLVIDNAEAIEPGLRIVDSRRILGNSMIDLVARDAKGALTLFALGATADERTLLRACDAYSWCLEHPDVVREVYPTATVPSASPRLLFIAEYFTETFRRSLKMLSSIEIDCLEFRHLEAGGTSAVYFGRVGEKCRAAATRVPNIEYSRLSLERSVPAYPAGNPELLSTERSVPADSAGDPEPSSMPNAGAAETRVDRHPAPDLPSGNGRTGHDYVVSDPLSDLKLEFPKDGALTRQWQEFLNLGHDTPRQPGG